jgi:hypothetical protein
MAPRRQAAPEGSMPPPSRPSSPGGEEIEEVRLFAAIDIRYKVYAYSTRYRRHSSIMWMNCSNTLVSFMRIYARDSGRFVGHKRTRYLKTQGNHPVYAQFLPGLWRP